MQRIPNWHACYSTTQNSTVQVLLREDNNVKNPSIFSKIYSKPCSWHSLSVYTVTVDYTRLRCKASSPPPHWLYLLFFIGLLNKFFINLMIYILRFGLSDLSDALVYVCAPDDNSILSYKRSGLKFFLMLVDHIYSYSLPASTHLSTYLLYFIHKLS